MIRLFWNEPNVVDSYVYEYKLFRSVGVASEDFAVLVTLRASELETLEYIDETVESGETYNYYIQAITESGDISSNSNIVELETAFVTYQELILAEPALIAFVPCTEESGPNLEVVEAAVGTVIGTPPTYGQPTTADLGTFGTDIPANGLINWPNPLVEHAPTNFSAEGWFKSAVTIGGSSTHFWAGAALVMGDSSTDQNDWGLGIFGDSQPMFGVGNPDSTTIAALDAYNDGEFHHAVGTYNYLTGETKLYVDAVLIGTSTHVGGGARPGHSNFWVGQNQPTVDWLATVCNLAIYSEVLTPEQIMAHYNKGVGA